jgi:hypothetical protein
VFKIKENIKQKKIILLIQSEENINFFWKTLPTSAVSYKHMIALIFIHFVRDGI